MGRSRTPSYEPQSFETRHGECRIEQGSIHLDEGPSWHVRRTIEGIRDADLGAFGKPALVVFTLLGTVSTLPGTLSRASDGAPWAVIGGVFVLGALIWQLSIWLRRWLFAPAEIRCSDVESVSRVGDDTLRVEYRDGPRRTSHDLKLPRKGTEDARREATSGFAAKGFEVERAERGRWYRELV